MSEFHGDLIVLADPPLALPPAAELRARLGELANVAVSLGEPHWGEAELLGTLSHTSKRRGVAMEAAPLAGIGYWRDYVPSALRDEDRQRAREAAVLQRVMAAAPEGGLALELRTGVSAYSVASFEESVRRRLAYALAWEATLAVGSLAPIRDRMPLLVGGSAAELQAALDGAPFSMVLNLFDALTSLASHARAHGAPPVAWPEPLRDGDEKRAALEGALERAATARAASLHEDGKLAVAALVEAAKEAAALERWFIDAPPAWASEPDSARYQLPSDPPAPQFRGPRFWND